MYVGHLHARREKMVCAVFVAVSIADERSINEMPFCLLDKIFLFFRIDLIYNLTKTFCQGCLMMPLEESEREKVCRADEKGSRVKMNLLMAYAS